MKDVTENFKIDLRTYGRQLDPQIKVNDEDFDIDNLNYIKPSFNTTLFKSVMHQVEIDSKVFMPKKTKLKIKLGIKVNEFNYEYINFNTYFVFSCERQEDTDSYRILAYSKIHESMIDFDLENLQDMTVRDYLILICNRLNWNTDNIPASFINCNKIVSPALHTGIQYTFRNVLDEIATITCSFFLFDDENFKMLYLTKTFQEIDESYLSEDDVIIGEKYFINSLVFSRAGESDNIFRKDDSSIEENGLHEFKIKDCQLLSTNSRVDFIDDMFSYLKDLEFYIFDVRSKGILFFDVADIFKFKLNNVEYPVILLNDEISIEDGLEEVMYFDKPEETETEYKYADETDRRINQTYIIVDKQNQKIESVIENVTEQNEKIAKVTQTIDELNSKISDLVDITAYSESVYAKVELNDINESEPILINIHPNLVSISYLYPNLNLFPSEDLFLKTRTLRYENTKTNEIIDYELPDDLLYFDSSIYDEFILDYENRKCQIIKRCGYDEYGNVYVLDNETTVDYEYPTISLTTGDYNISLLGYSYGYLKVRLVASNIYTSQFVTRVEMNSEISQKVNEVNIKVSEKLDGKDFTHASIVAKINDDTSQVLIEADKIRITANDVIDILAGNTLNLTSKTISISSTNFSVTPNGTVTMKNANITGVFTNYDSGGNLAVKIANQRIDLYDWKNKGVWVGNICSVYTESTKQSGVAITARQGDDIVIGYSTSENDTSVNVLMKFDLSNLDSVPYIKNTADGTIFPNAGNGIKVENGLIKSWNLNGLNTTLFSDNSRGGLVVKNGLIVSGDFYGTSRTFRVASDIGYYDLVVTNGLITDWTYVSPS